MSSFRSGDRLSDLGAAVGAFVDEVDFCSLLVELNLLDIHGKQSYAAGADCRCVLDLIVLDVGWHFGSPFRRSTNLNLA